MERRSPGRRAEQLLPRNEGTCRRVGHWSPVTRTILAATAAAALLSACQTIPQDDPYGSPVAGPYPPAADPVAPGTCPIASSRDWRAWIDSSPESSDRPALVVTGTVVAPTGGYRMEFDPYLQAMRSYPVQLVATLRPMPPDGPATQALTTHDVRWQWPLQSSPVGAVMISCGSQTLARISPVGTQP